MERKVTIAIDRKVYEELCAVVGAPRVARVIEELIRAEIESDDLDSAYAELARDEAREAEAEAWSDALIADLADDPG